jgi:hypothetical protein
MESQYIIIAIALLISIKAYKAWEQMQQSRKYKQVNRVIYNYHSKTRQQIIDILELETNLLSEQYTIHEYSKPLFKNDGSATYIIYVTPKITNARNTL